jgi:PhzF family phenazine biosynthesis protein
MPLTYEVHRLASPQAVAEYRLEDEPDHRLVWAFGDEGADDIVRARFFAAGLGVAEDPATGSAAVALAAVLRHEGTHSGALTIHQGAEIGSPSRIDLTWTATYTLIGGAVADDGSRSISARRGS